MEYAGLRALIGETPARSQAGAAPIRIFEMGLGTGLNALLSMLEAVDTCRPILYETVETTPLPHSMIRELNYCRLLGRPEWEPLKPAAMGKNISCGKKHNSSITMPSTLSCNRNCGRPQSSKGYIPN